MCTIELDCEMEMPTPCQRCGEWFDLNDGMGSEKWYPNTVICEKCGREEQEEIEQDEEIRDLKESIDDAEQTIKDARSELAARGIDIPTFIWTPLY